MNSDALPRTIGLPGMVFTLVGVVVGAGIFILPGQLAATAGPSIWIAYLLAAIPAFFVCFLYAEIGNVFPVSGASYVAVTRVISPFAGFMVVWTIVAGTAAGAGLVAYGFADYLAYFLPALDRQLVALSTIMGFTVLNILGAKMSVTAQGVMVVVVLLILLLFCFGGLVHRDATLMTPAFPHGAAAVAQAAVPAYFSFLGFAFIAELAGEVQRPARTIPLALLLSFGCVLFFYLFVSWVLPGLISWTELGSTVGPVATASALFLPEWGAAAVAGGTLLAVATTINGGLLAISRAVYVLAHNGLLPPLFGRIHPRLHTPAWAIFSLGSLWCVGVLAGTTITQYAIIGVLGTMIVKSLVALVVLRAPRTVPSQFEQSPFTLGPRVRVLACSIVLVYAVAFIGWGVASNPKGAAAFMVVLLLGALYYGSRMRRHDLKNSEASRDDI